MGSESIAHEAEGRIGYWLRGHEGKRNNRFSKIQLVVYYQCCVLIGWATTRLYVIAY